MNYDKLVSKRKKCTLCKGLTNPSAVLHGTYDSDHIGPWSRWQGNLNSKLVIVGQDWGGVDFYTKNKGLDPLSNRTNDTLVYLLNSIGLTINSPQRHDTVGNIFLTNAILCLKNGNLQAKVEYFWFDNCIRQFLRPLLEIVNPKIVIALGEKAYTNICKTFNIKQTKFRNAVEMDKGFRLPTGVILFPRYHCGARILNTHRPIKNQLADWAKLKKFLN